MITFINRHNCIFDEETLSNAIEWYARLKGVQVETYKTIWVHSDDYLCVAIGRKHVRVHRLLMMYHLKRELKSSEELVHHRDGNRLNCVLSNLAVTTGPKHTTYHIGRPDISNYAIAEMLEQGKSQHNIARHFECSDAAICGRVKRMREGK